MVKNIPPIVGGNLISSLEQHFNQNINLPARFNNFNGLDVKAVDDSTGSLVDSRNYYLDSVDGKKYIFALEYGVL